jgi:hypothetical protein
MNNFFRNNTYVAVIADIKGSKAIKNREQINGVIHNYLLILNILMI